MSILQMSLYIPTLPHNLSSSSSSFLSNQTHLFLTSKFSHLSITKPPKPTIIRMGGGPRTYPGGVSKWQWKRMQAKKAKQLLRARLARERQIYEMRKRAELKAAVSELERPWEVVEKAPKLFSASADEQVKVLADRFQKPGGFDLWSEKDGPQLFETLDRVPSARFFPKGVVHSIKPYERISDGISEDELDSGSGSGLENSSEENLQRNVLYDKNSRKLSSGLLPSEGETVNESENGKSSKGKFRKNGNRRRIVITNSGNSNGFDQKESGRSCRNGDSGGRIRRGNGSQEKFKSLNSKVFDMSLQNDGSYGFSNGEMDIPKSQQRKSRKEMKQ